MLLVDLPPPSTAMVGTLVTLDFKFGELVPEQHSGPKTLLRRSFQPYPHWLEMDFSSQQREKAISECCIGLRFGLAV